MKSIFYSLLLATLPALAAERQPATFDPGTSGSKIATGTQKAFDLDSSILRSEDLRDWTPAITLDALYQSGSAVDWPTQSWSLRFAAHGTFALDPDLNRDPLRASIDLYYEAMPGFKRESDAWNDPLVAGEHGHSNPALFEAGFSAAYETDQNWDHSNGVVSAFVRFLQPLGNDWRGNMPSITAAFDGVMPNENATADAMKTERDAHVRVRVQADWVLRFSTFKATRNTVLKRLSLHAAAVYTKEFGPPASWETAGLDEAFGAYVEAAWVLSTGVDPEGANHRDPVTLFARTTFGRFEPIPEDDRGLLIGLRYSF